MQGELDVEIYDHAGLFSALHLKIDDPQTPKASQTPEKSIVTGRNRFLLARR
jgi:hypothetical protein